MTAPVLDPIGTEPSDPEEGGRLWVKVLIAAFLVGTALLWIYALWGPRTPPPGTMDDPAFGVAAEQVCAEAVARIDELPLAQETPEAGDRSAVLTEADVILAEQLDELDELVALTPEGSEDRRRVTEWLADWRVHLEDRQSYAEEILVNPMARFHETAKEERPISFVLGEFAKKNDMPSCAPPGDIA
jgi:hypothetical protein